MHYKKGYWLIAKLDTHCAICIVLIRAFVVLYHYMLHAVLMYSVLLYANVDDFIYGQHPRRKFQSN